MVSKVLFKFLSDEDGAVTVDWVVLTAGIVGLGIMVVAMLNGETGSIGNKVGSFLSVQTIASTF